MKRFVVGTNRTTTEQDNAFLSLVRARWPYIGWWHQLSETWLFVDPLDTLTSGALRDAATQAFPGIRLIVLEAYGPHLWSGFGRREEFSWMLENWDRSG